jgi:hypothetical protein
MKGYCKHKPNATPTWRTDDKYLSRAKVRAHLRGSDTYGCWGNEWSKWIALLKVISELPDFFPEVRWFYVLNRNAISGLHLVGLLPKPWLLEDVKADVRKKTTCTGGGNGMGTIQPLKGRHLEFITGVVLGTEPMPDDTIGSWSVNI